MQAVRADSHAVQAPQLYVCVEQSHIAVSNYLQALCLNRTRVRRRLRNGIDDWQRMRVHASNADNSEELVQFLFGSGQWDLPAHAEVAGPCSVRRGRRLWAFTCTIACCHIEHAAQARAGWPAAARRSRGGGQHPCRLRAAVARRTRALGIDGLFADWPRARTLRCARVHGRVLVRGAHVRAQDAAPE